MRRRLRLSGGLRTFSGPIASALLLAACGGSASTNSRTSSTTATTATTSSAPPAPRIVGAAAALAPRCTAGQLSSRRTATQGAPGHVETGFALRNSSAHGCTLRGYPGALMLDAQGRTMATHLTRGNGFFPDTTLAPRTVTIGVHGGARFTLSYADNSEYAGGQRCPTAATLEITPPQSHGALRVSVSGGGRPRFAPCGGRLTASPVYAG
ncbi:MAG TPA: DUF4232 domain-containing protein [Solirubrobacteraceae bacterium]|nr:DUF4232 domain-containing protein [Solirubrobacteraceae bacterium]